MNHVVKICILVLAAVYMIAAAQVIVLVQEQPSPEGTAQPTLSADAVIRPELYVLR